MSNYLTYPMKNMRITQGYGGTTSHKPHWYNSRDYKDYPIDDAGADGGRDWFYAPCDCKIVKIYGVGNSGTNTVWIESTAPCDTACGENVYITMQVTHPNDDDLRKLRAGQVFKRGAPMFREGTDGATGNHLHISVGKGHMTSGGWDKNSNGKWCLRTTVSCYYPENAFFVDPSFTKVTSSNGLKFKNVPAVAAATKPTATDSAESFLPARGYFKKGDTSSNVGKLASFMYKTFPAYTSKAALGNVYGDNLIKSIKIFQSKTGLEPDGCTGAKTLEMMKRYGFKEC